MLPPRLKQNKTKTFRLVGFLIIYRVVSKFHTLHHCLCSPRPGGFSVLDCPFLGPVTASAPSAATFRPTLPALLRYPFFQGAFPDLPDLKQLLLLLCLTSSVTSHTPHDILGMIEHARASSSVCRVIQASLMAQTVKNPPAMKETQVRSLLGQEDPLGKSMATYSSILAWRIPRREEPGGIQSMGSQRVGHD